MLGCGVPRACSGIRGCVTPKSPKSGTSPRHWSRTCFQRSASSLTTGVARPRGKFVRLTGKAPAATHSWRQGHCVMCLSVSSTSTASAVLPSRECTGPASMIRSISSGAARSVRSISRTRSSSGRHSCASRADEMRRQPPCWCHAITARTSASVSSVSVPLKTGHIATCRQLSDSPTRTIGPPASPLSTCAAGKVPQSTVRTIPFGTSSMARSQKVSRRSRTSQSGTTSITGRIWDCTSADACPSARNSPALPLRIGT